MNSESLHRKLRDTNYENAILIMMFMHVILSYYVFILRVVKIYSMYKKN